MVEYKKGDWLYHLEQQSIYWTKGKVFQFDSYTSDKKDYIRELKSGGGTCYTHKVRLADPWEIPEEFRLKEQEIQFNLW